MEFIGLVESGVSNNRVKNRMQMRIRAEPRGVQ